MGHSLAVMANFLQPIILLVMVLVAIKITGRHGFWWRKTKKRYHPIAGTIVHKFLNFRRCPDYLTDISRKYKTFRLYAPFRNLIYTTDPAIVEYILKTNFKNYSKGQYNYENLKELFGNGIFAVDGEQWHHQRKLASYKFSTRALRNYSTSVFKTNATKLTYIIFDKAKSDLAFDIQELFMSSTMDSIFKIGLGVDLMNLDGSVDGIKFTKAFDNANVYILSRYVDVFWKFKRFFNLGYEAQLKKDINVINDFIYNLILAKKENMTNAKSNLEKKEDIISRFMAEMEHDPKNITYEYLRDIALNFVIAGKDTIAGTLSWFIYLLCKHPSVQEKFFQEVKEATQAGQDICISEFAEKISEESLEKMTYLHAALSETLRLYPSVPMNVKSCFSDDTLPDGFNVNQGDVVFYMPYPMGRMEILWGDDAKYFQPERWLDDDGSVRNESPFKFTAFQGQYNYEILKELFGDGIFAVDGEKWHHQRKLVSYEFSTRALRNYSISVFKTNATKLAYIIFDKAKSDLAFDIQELFMSSTMDSIFKIGFGVDLMNLDGSIDGIKFTKAFDNASVYIVSRYVDVFWKFKRFFNIGYEAQLKKDINVINDFIYNLIRAKKENMTDAKSNLERKEDIISRFMAEMEHDPKNITYEYLRDIVLNFVIAGKDTTAGTLSWFIYLLCKHPSVQEEIFQEVKEATQGGHDICFNEFVEKITVESLDKMKYLHAALSETLRLYPSVPLNSKSCFSDDTLPDGFNVNRGDVVFYMPYPMGRMEILWGDDAENFQPERWLDDDGSVRNESPFKFTAFQAGPRICLGKDFAYTQMKIFAAVLLHFFKFKLSSKSNDVHYKTMITLHIDQGLYVHAYLR